MAASILNMPIDLGIEYLFLKIGWGIKQPLQFCAGFVVLVSVVYFSHLTLDVSLIFQKKTTQVQLHLNKYSKSFHFRPNKNTLCIFIRDNMDKQDLSTIRGIRDPSLLLKLFGWVTWAVWFWFWSWSFTAEPGWCAGYVNVLRPAVGAVWDGSRPVTRGSWEKDSSQWALG